MKLALAALALAGGALAAGCSMQSATDASNGTPAAPLSDGRNSGGTATTPSEDAATVAPTVYRGNPLCHVNSESACVPDDDGDRLTAGAKTCGLGAPHGDDAGVTNDMLACRISRSAADGVVAPTCVAQASGAGVDGDSCQVGNDCATGFDCVAGEKGTKACRHYCCAGSCKGHASNNGGATFCDVQGLVDVNQKAPVCMPLKRCKLLGTGECTASESCAVVTESGDTGCVATGEQQVGASCDEDHCAATLTCLGQPGSRKCFKLCKVSASDCEASQVCATSTVFKDPSFGICQKP